MTTRWPSRAIRHSVPVLAILAAPAVMSSSQGRTGVPIVSAWRGGEVTVDGLNTEWPDLSAFGQESRYAIGLVNDDENLYVALRANDPATGLQMLRQGLVVWFDAEGGTRKRFGIKYPVGTLSYGVAEAGSGRGGRGRPSRQGGPAAPAGPDASWSQAEADGQLNRLEVLGPGDNDRRSLVVGRADPLAVGIGRSEGTVLYELKIPIARSGDAPYSLGVKPGRTFGLGLENAERERTPGGMGFSGGLPGGPGGSGGQGGGPPPGGDSGASGTGGRPERPEAPKPLKAWVTARLAANPAER